MRSGWTYGQGSEVFRGRDRIREVALPPAAVVGLLEVASVAGAAPHVGQQDDVSALREVLDRALEAVLPLGRGPAVGPHDRGVTAVVGARALGGSVEVGGDDEPVTAPQLYLGGRDQSVFDPLDRHRISQPGFLPRIERVHDQIAGARRRLQRVGDAAAVRRPLGRTDDAGFGTGDDAGPAAPGVSGPELIGAAVVLDVRERVAVERPHAVRLVGIGRRKRPGFASRAGDAPVVDPAGAVGREYHRGPIRRDQRIAERSSFAIVEEVPVLDNHPFLAASGRNLDDRVVHPLVIESHEEDRAASPGSRLGKPPVRGHRSVGAPFRMGPPQSRRRIVRSDCRRMRCCSHPATRNSP